VAEEAVVDLNIKTKTSFFFLYQLWLRTVANLNTSAEQNRLKTLAKVMMHENDSLFCEMSTDTAVTTKPLLTLCSLSA